MTWPLTTQACGRTTGPASKTSKSCSCGANRGGHAWPIGSGHDQETVDRSARGGAFFMPNHHLRGTHPMDHAMKIPIRTRNLILGSCPVIVFGALLLHWALT